MKNTTRTVLIFLVLAASACLSIGAERVAVAANFKNYVEPWITWTVFEASKEGDLRMVIDINEDGTIADWMIIRAHHEEFADAIRRVVDEWTFHPASMDGEPIPIVMEFMFHFSKRGTSLVEGNLTELYLQRLPSMQKDYVVVRSFNELDRLPEPVNIVPPVISSGIPMEERTGSVIVSFYIDETGRVRIPVIEEYTGHLRIADAAYNAILQWEFKPPTIRGRPVTVKVQQPFEFKP